MSPGHYHVDVIYLLTKSGIRKGAWGLGLHQLGFRPTFFVPRWTLNLRIQRQVCDARVLDCMAILIVSRTARFD